MKLRRQGSHQRRFASLESVCENCGMKTKWVRHTKFDAIRPGYAITEDDTGGCTDGKFVVQISSDISVSFLSLQSLATLPVPIAHTGSYAITMLL